MPRRSNLAIPLIRIGIVAGFVASLFYPLMLFAPLPGIVTAWLAALLGPAIGVASIGLDQRIQLDTPSALARLGAFFNFTAGALFCAMLMVQLTVRMNAAGSSFDPDLVGVWLGLDLAWDVYIGLGTLAFGIAMWRHPRFGIWFGATGIVLALALLILNGATLPTPPAEAGSIDVGPAVGIWYLAVTIQTWRSLRWIER